MVRAILTIFVVLTFAGASRGDQPIERFELDRLVGNTVSMSGDLTCVGLVCRLDDARGVSFLSSALVDITDLPLADRTTAVGSCSLGPFACRVIVTGPVKEISAIGVRITAEKIVFVRTP